MSDEEPESKEGPATIIGESYGDWQIELCGKMSPFHTIDEKHVLSEVAWLNDAIQPLVSRAALADKMARVLEIIKSVSECDGSVPCPKCQCQVMLKEYDALAQQTNKKTHFPTETLSPLCGEVDEGGSFFGEWNLVTCKKCLARQAKEIK